jgi:hypothetical protein
LPSSVLAFHPILIELDRGCSVCEKLSLEQGIEVVNETKGTAKDNGSKDAANDANPNFVLPNLFVNQLFN